MKKLNLFCKSAIILALVFLFTGGVYAKSDEKKKVTATKKTETANKADKTAAKVNINKASEEELTQLKESEPQKRNELWRIVKKMANLKIRKI